MKVFCGATAMIMSGGWLLAFGAGHQSSMLALAVGVLGLGQLLEGTELREPQAWAALLREAENRLRHRRRT